MWQPQTAALLDVRVVDTDAQSYASRTVDAVLCSAEQEKKRKYSAAVEDRRASFTPFVVSVDGVLGHDAQHLMKRLCDQIAEKWEKSHSEVMGWVRARMAFAILRATNLCGDLGYNGEVDMAWMMELAFLIFLTDIFQKR